MEILLVGAGVLSFVAYRDKIVEATTGRGETDVKSWLKDKPGHINEAVDPWVQLYKRSQRNYQVAYRGHTPTDNPNARVFNDKLVALYYSPEWRESFAQNYALQNDQDHNLLQLAKLRYPYNCVKQRVDWIGGEDSMSVFSPAENFFEDNE